MNLIFSCIGKRGYIADFFREHLAPGDRIIGTSNNPWTPGFAQCDEGVLMPPIASDEYIPAVLDTCKRYEARALFSFYDPDVARLAPEVSTFTEIGVSAFIPGENAAIIGFDKWRTFQVLREAGFLVPDTWIDLDLAIEALSIGKLSFPVIVKPREGFGSANTFMARNELQLRAFFSVSQRMLIQQFIEGETFDVETFSDLSGQVLQVVVWRKWMSRLGETEQASTVLDPELLDIGKRLAEAVGNVGPMDADLFRTADGRVWVLELNLRFGGGYPVSHLAGAGFPELAIAIARGESPAPRIGQYKPGVSMLKSLQILGGPEKAFLKDLRTGVFR